jgi:hypothetical protein
MKLKKLTAAACIGMMLLACQKENHGTGTAQKVTGKQKSDKDVMAEFFAQNRENNTQSYTFDADKGTQIRTEHGAQLFIDGSVLVDANGNQAHGDISVSLLEVYNRKDGIFNNLTTQHILTEEDVASGVNSGVLLTGGAFMLTMTNADGVRVTAPNGGAQMVVPANLTGGADPDMGMWEGVVATIQPRDNNWIRRPQAQIEVGADYSFPIPGWDWWNIDHYMNLGGPFTTLEADLPVGYDEDNAEIFLVYSGIPNSFSSMDVFVPATASSTAYWKEHGNVIAGGNIQIGRQGHFVVVAMLNGVLYSEIKPFTIVPNHFEHFTNLAPTTSAALAAAIQALP